MCSILVRSPSLQQLKHSQRSFSTTLTLSLTRYIFTSELMENLTRVSLPKLALLTDEKNSYRLTGALLMISSHSILLSSQFLDRHMHTHTNTTAAPGVKEKGFPSHGCAGICVSIRARVVLVRWLPSDIGRISAVLERPADHGCVMIETSQ